MDKGKIADSVIKISFLFPFDGGTDLLNNKGFNDYILKPLQSYLQYNIEVVHPSDDCDICFYSIGFEKPHFEVGGKNGCIKVFCLFEDPRTFPNAINLGHKYTISMYNDTVTNLNYPLWAIATSDYYKYRQDSFNKTKFCTFLSSNAWLNSDGVNFRIGLFDELSSKYKQVDGCGSVRNTIGYNLPHYTVDMWGSVDFHKPYKFNICSENWSTHGDLMYCTEKLVNAYTYGCVPIYYGWLDVETIFNKNSFINCNGKTYNEIIDEIQYYDNNDLAYYTMLNEYPFTCNIQYDLFYQQKLAQFISKIIAENNLG